MTYSRLVAILWLAVIMFFTALPADRCTTPTDPTCILAVYKGAPDDYAHVQDIPDSVLIQPDDHGRYQVERGQQITVVTAASLPTGYTRFYLQRSPQIRPSPTSHEQLIQPVGTTYTFSSIGFEGGASLLTFDLTAARPQTVQRPGTKPQLGDVVVTTTFDVLTPPPTVTPVEVPLSAYNADALPPGTYQFPALRSGQRPLIIQIPTTDHQIKWQEIILSDPGGISFCLSDLAGTSALCLAQTDGREVYRAIPDPSPTDASVTISDVFDYIAASATVEGTTGSQVKSDTLRYRSYDASGAVATPGSYAFLIDSSLGASVVATFEGLRDGTATALLVHQSDAYGASQAQVYDPILAGDLFEWRQADDCWVRYRVTEVKSDPTGIIPRKLLAVEWMTYAFSGCSGAVSTNVAASFAWGSLPDVGGTKLMVPIRHGSFQIVPDGWTGTIERDPLRQWPGNSFENPVTTTDLSAARQLPHWLDPVLPTGWTLVAASSGVPSSDPPYGYCARWNTAGDTGGVQICGGFMEALDRPVSSSDANGGITTVTRVIAGRPAIVRFSPPGPQHLRLTQVEVWIDDASRGVAYYIRGLDGTLIGANVNAVIAIARSLFASRVQLTATAGEGGSVEPTGMTTHAQGEPVTLTASWNDATHTFGGWGDDCSGTATTCVLEMYANASVTAAFTALPTDRCSSPTDADCIRAVYKGVPDDYAQVQDIPASLLIQPNTDGHYVVERGQQITVVTAAPLPTGYTRSYLQRRPVPGASPTSYEQLIPPIGTTYTFTPIEFEGAADELSFDLRAAKPPLRPGLKPQLGLVMVTVIFRIQTPPLALVPANLTNSHYNGAALEPGTYQFPPLRYNHGHLIVQIPTSPHQIKWDGLILNEISGVTYCLTDVARLSSLCFQPNDASESYRFISPSASSALPVTIEEVFDFISESAHIGPVTP